MSVVAGAPATPRPRLVFFRAVCVCGEPDALWMTVQTMNPITLEARCHAEVLDCEDCGTYKRTDDIDVLAGVPLGTMAR